MLSSQNQGNEPNTTVTMTLTTRTTSGTWDKPQRFAALGPALKDVRTAMVAANVNQAEGGVGGGQRLI